MWLYMWTWLYAQDREMAIAAGDQESTTAGAGVVAVPKHNDLSLKLKGY